MRDMGSAIPRLMFARPLADGRQPCVTVVVLCYNYGHFLPQCLGSLLTQTGVDVKIMVIDDASPDGSGEVAEELAAADKRITVIRHVRNMGNIATANEGFGHVASEYVVLLSADDLLPPGALARATALLDANPSAGFAYGHPVNFSGAAVPPARQVSRTWSIWPGPKWLRAQCRRGLGCIYSPEVVMRTDVQRRVGDANLALPHTADLEMWLRFAAVADVGRVNGADQGYRRVHANSMMQTRFSGVLADLSERRKAYEAFFAASGAAVAGADRSLAIVRRRLAEEALQYACQLAAEGDSESPMIADCVSFACDCGPDTKKLAAWREYELLSGREGRETARMRRRAYALRRDLDGRLRHKQWQWAGV